jgi:hypothetical protein
MQLFGINIEKIKTAEEKSAAIVAPSNEDGASQIVSSGSAFFGVYLDVEGAIKNESQAIQSYREIASYAEVDAAISDIVDEAIPNEDDSSQIDLICDEEISENIRESIQAEFKTVLNLLNFGDVGSDVFRQWYVDGRINYQVLVDKNNPNRGILELRKIEATKIKKIREIKKEKSESGVDIITGAEEYFLFNEAGFITSAGPSSNSVAGAAVGVKLSPDSVIYVPSGLTDVTGQTVQGHLHKAIRPVNQLRLMEDSLLINRIARAPERRIFYVDVGTLPKGKADQYMKDIMNQYRNKMVYDSVTGQVKSEKKHQCLAMDTKIPLLDGRTLTIEEIAKEYSAGETLWAYSCDPITGKFAPGLISWAGKTRENAEVLTITLDNGKTITCTPDHKFPVWNKGFVSAEDLLIGESMVPHYTRDEVLNKKTNQRDRKPKPYAQIFANDLKKWQFLHRAVSAWKDSVGIDNEFVYKESRFDLDKKTIHHKNFNKFDNSPDNLVRMNSSDHANYHRNIISLEVRQAMGRHTRDLGLGFFNRNHPEYHQWHVNAGHSGGTASSISGASLANYAKGRTVLADLMQDQEWNSWFREQQTLGWTADLRKKSSDNAKLHGLSAKGNAAKQELYADKDSDTCKLHSLRYKTEYSQSIIEHVMSYAQQQFSAKEAARLINECSDLVAEFAEMNADKVMSNKDYSKITDDDVTRIALHLVGGYTKLKESMQFRNHKIVNIERLTDRMDTGCITIDGEEKYHNHHTFALDAGIYTRNSMLEDYWLPRRDNSKSTEITTLPGATNLNQIDDVTIFKTNMYQSLNVPMSRMQPETGFSLGRTTEISRDELKFQKFIDRLRKKFSQLFYDTLKTQLVLKGVCNDIEWKELREYIHFRFQRDNFFSELKNLDVLQARMAIMPQIDPYLGKYFSKYWVQKNILKFTDEMVEQMDQEIYDEKDDPMAKPSFAGGMDPSMMGGGGGMPPPPMGGDPSGADGSGQDDDGQDQQQFPLQGQQGQ